MERPHFRHLHTQVTLCQPLTSSGRAKLGWTLPNQAASPKTGRIRKENLKILTSSGTCSSLQQIQHASWTEIGSPSLKFYRPGLAESSSYGLGLIGNLMLS